MTIPPLDLNDVRLELDLGSRGNLILNHSGEFGLAGWHDVSDPADRADVTNINGKNGTLSVQTDVDGPYFRGIPAASTPTEVKYRTNYMPVKPWKGIRVFTYGVYAASPVGGATQVDVFLKFMDSSFALLYQGQVTQSITPGAAYVEVRGAVSAGSTDGVAFVELVVRNNTSSLAGKQLNFRKATVFSVPGLEDPSGIAFPADTWTDVSDYVLSDSNIRRGNSLSGANESIETGMMTLNLAGETYAPNSNKEVRPGLRARWSIWDGTQWRTRFVGEMYGGTVRPRLDGTNDRTFTQLGFRDLGAYLQSSPAATLYNGSYRQRVAQAMGRRIPYVASPSGETELVVANKSKLTIDDSMVKAGALELIRNTYVAIRDPGDTWLDRSGHLHCHKGDDEYINRKPFLFATRAPVTSTNMAQSDIRTNQYSRPNPNQIVDWQLTTPTNTLIPVSTTLGNDQKAWAALGETLTCQVYVVAQQAVRFIPQVVTNTTTVSGTPVELEAGDEQHFIWSRVFDATDAANGVKFQLRFEEPGGGAFSTVSGNYAQVYKPLVMVGTWTEPEQYFDGSYSFASWIDKPTQSGSQGSFFGAWSVRDLSAPNMGIVNDGLDLTFDTTAVVNRLKIVHKGLETEEAHGPFFNRASLNEWGDSSTEYAMNDKGPATAASYIFGRLAQPQTFPTRVRWNASDSLDKLGTFDINDQFGVLHNDTVIDCKVLFLTETISYYDSGTKAKYIVDITPKPYQVGLEAGDVDTGPTEEQYAGGVADTPLSDLNPPAPVTVSAEQATAGTTTSASYVETLTGGTACAFTFIAPPSGKVLAVNTGQLDNSSTAQTSLMSFVIRTGGTIGSGSTFFAASDDDALRNIGTNESQYSHVRVIEGLTPGDTYNIRQAFRGSGGTIATFSRKRLAVIPLT